MHLGVEIKYDHEAMKESESLRVFLDELDGMLHPKVKHEEMVQANDLILFPPLQIFPTTSVPSTRF
jgi:hypothetical protein